jgi:hypothetical protein
MQNHEIYISSIVACFFNHSHELLEVDEAVLVFVGLSKDVVTLLCVLS